MPSVLQGVFLGALLFGCSTLAEFQGRDHTYWVDVSCHGRLGDAVNEAFETAKLVAKLLPEENSFDLQGSKLDNAFSALFARDAPDFWYLTEAATQDLGAIFGGGPHSLPKFRPNQENQLEAEVRIYCDDDNRWEEREDDPKQNEGVPNSKRGPDEKEWIDAVNSIVWVGKRGCEIGADMVMYGRIAERLSSESQHPKRATITVCDTFLNKPDRINTFTKDIPQKKYFSKGAVETITNLNQITSMKLFHELMHHTRYNKDDIPDPTRSRDAYGWKKCVEKPEDEARQNADNWSLLGVAARCLQRRFEVNPQDPRSGALVFNKELKEITLRKRKRAPLLGWLPGFSGMKREVVSAKDSIV